MEIYTHQRYITIDDVRIGMFIEDVFDASGTLIANEQMSIKDQNQISLLRMRGVVYVTIDIVHGKDVEEIMNSDENDGIIFDTTETIKSDTDLLDQSQTSHTLSDRVNANEETSHTLNTDQSYFLELQRAKKIYAQALESVTEAFRSVRRSRIFSLSKIREISESIVASIQRNPDALVSLTQLRGMEQYLFSHSTNVGILVTMLTSLMGYKENDLPEICMGGILHDIGKQFIPEGILKKPGKLTDYEYKIIMQHPKYGIDLVAKKPGIHEMTKLIIIQHHERYNGSGYPQGIKSHDINELGLIGAVADVYDALTSDRVYQSAWTPQKALATIFQGCDKQYSKNIVQLFTRHVGIYPVGSFVKLANGKMGIVTRVEAGSLLTPRLLILIDEQGRKLATPFDIDLKEFYHSSEAESYKIEISLNPKTYGINPRLYLRGC